MKWIVLVLIYSCSHKQSGFQEAWKKRPISEVKTHLFFSLLPQREHDHTYDFIEQSPYRSMASCTALSGCAGMPYFDCEYQFKVKDNIIAEVTRTGQCRQDGSDLPRKD